MSTKRIVLVGCCAEKLDRVAPARQLYRSQLFRKASTWAQAQGAPWFVLSAAYGLIKPDDQLAPYDKTHANMTPAERSAWAGVVHDQISGLCNFWDVEQLEIVMLAGEKYAGWIPLVEAWGCKVVQPMKGMQVGQRLQWLTAQLAGQGLAQPEQEELFA